MLTRADVAFLDDETRRSDNLSYVLAPSHSAGLIDRVSSALAGSPAQGATASRYGYDKSSWRNTPDSPATGAFADQTLSGGFGGQDGGATPQRGAPGATKDTPTDSASAAKWASNQEPRRISTSRMAGPVVTDMPAAPQRRSLDLSTSRSMDVPRTPAGGGDGGDGGRGDRRVSTSTVRWLPEGELGARGTMGEWPPQIPPGADWDGSALADGWRPAPLAGAEPSRPILRNSQTLPEKRETPPSPRAVPIRHQQSSPQVTWPTPDASELRRTGAISRQQSSPEPQPSPSKSVLPPLPPKSPQRSPHASPPPSPEPGISWGQLNDPGQSPASGYGPPSHAVSAEGSWFGGAAGTEAASPIQAPPLPPRPKRAPPAAPAAALAPAPAGPAPQ